MNDLRAELERQLEIINSNRPEKTSNTGFVSITNLGDVAQFYYRDLVVLDQLCREQDTVDGSYIASFRIDDSVFWRVPAFCQNTGSVLNQHWIKDRYRRLQSSRRVRNSFAEKCEEIWAKNEVVEWLAGDGDPIIMVQGNSQSTGRVQQFTLEMVEHLEKSCEPIFLLDTPPPLDSNGMSLAVTALDILKQIAIQALQQVPWLQLTEPVLVLASVTSLIRNATTVEDWVNILYHALTQTGGSTMVINLHILRARWQEAQSWPALFQDLLERLRSSPDGEKKVRVMLLSCHKFSPSSETSQIVHVEKTRSSSFSSRLPSNNISGTHARAKTANAITDDSARKIFTRPAVGQASPDTAASDEASQNSGSSCHQVTQAPVIAAIEESQLASISTSEVRSSPHPRPKTRDDFKVAILCALPLEADAVEASFDQHWDADWFGKGQSDTNSYATGVIGHHNVVLVYMPGMGKTDATLAAANCASSFQNIQLALVVGICGGVPRNGSTEVMLGDVVFGKEIVPYDFGRQFPDKFVRKAGPGKPGPKIRSLLAKLEGRVARRELRASTNLHLVPLIESLGTSSRYPGMDGDKLYEPRYRHKHQDPADCVVCASCHNSSDPVCEAALTASCVKLKCDESHTMTRSRNMPITQGDGEPPGDGGPSIHFGLMASGDTVMKSGEQRDAVAAREGILAFEMEAAGVANVFHSNCLVVKAVCDYADSHKNKAFQAYSAATAAACTKAFLQHWAVPSGSL